MDGGSVLPHDGWVQRDEGLLNKTLSALTRGLFYSVPGKLILFQGRDTCSAQGHGQQGCPAVAPRGCTLLETMFKALGEPWGDHGWG